MRIAAAPEAAASAATAANLTPVVTPFSYQGTTETAAGFFAVAGGDCLGGPGSNAFYDLDTPTDARHLAAAITCPRRRPPRRS